MRLAGKNRKGAALDGEWNRGVFVQCIGFARAPRERRRSGKHAQLVVIAHEIEHVERFAVVRLGKGTHVGKDCRLLIRRQWHLPLDLYEVARDFVLGEPAADQPRNLPQHDCHEDQREHHRENGVEA